MKEKLKQISPDLAAVVDRGWGCDVYPKAMQAGFYGDCDFGTIQFKYTLKREEIAAIATAIRNAPKALELLQTALEDGECYCADNVACKEPCAWCQIKGFIG